MARDDWISCWVLYLRLIRLTIMIRFQVFGACCLLLCPQQGASLLLSLSAVNLARLGPS
jgi:hypothetical protein